MSSSREFARLLRGEEKKRQRQLKLSQKSRRLSFIPIARLRESLRRIDGLRVRMPDLSDSVLAFRITQITPGTSSSGKTIAAFCQEVDLPLRAIKMRKLSERPKITKDVGLRDLGQSNAVSCVIALVGDDWGATGLEYFRERFNLMEVDCRSILQRAVDGDDEGSGDAVRATKAEIDNYQDQAQEVSRRMAGAWYVQRIYRLHLLLYRLVSWILEDFPHRACAEGVGEHLPVFVVAPRSVSFLFDVATLPLDILRAHRRVVFSYQ